MDTESFPIFVNLNKRILTFLKVDLVNLVIRYEILYFVRDNSKMHFCDWCLWRNVDFPLHVSIFQKINKNYQFKMISMKLIKLDLIRFIYIKKIFSFEIYHYKCQILITRLAYLKPDFKKPVFSEENRISIFISLHKKLSSIVYLIVNSLTLYWNFFQRLMSNGFGKRRIKKPILKALLFKPKGIWMNSSLKKLFLICLKWDLNKLHSNQIFMINTFLVSIFLK